MYKLLITLFFSFISLQANAVLTIEISGGAEGTLPIAVVPYAWKGNASQKPAYNVGEIVNADLQRSGRFKTLDTSKMLAKPTQADSVDFRDWRAVKVENLVIGEVLPNGPGSYQVRFYLYDVFRGEQVLGYNFTTTTKDLRATAHHISDLIYETLTGIPGAFATRIAYVTEVTLKNNKRQVQLKVADADGFGPHTIVSSSEPIMSPAWSPKGRKIAYVSFEKSKPSIWVQEVFTGKREKITSFKGINGAPAWSPDGNSLAMTLSKDGNSEIYIMDLIRKKLKRITNHWGIDTEPSWSPDGRKLVFTSNRGGAPQIYEVSTLGGKAKRLTFDGKYNARASYSPDGTQITMVTRVNGQYRIGILELESGIQTVLSTGTLDESPSYAPNGSMIIYATRGRDKGVLAAVSTDGRIKQRLALQQGDVREPIWSPYYQRGN